MADWLQRQWLTFTLWHLLLLPISWLFFIITACRRLLYKLGLLNSHRFSVPVIVVGNINVGGAGKTPVVIWLAEQLKQAGYKPGVISRGYGSNLVGIASVLPTSSPTEMGDEPVLIAMRTACPVFVGAQRVAVGLALLKAHPECNVLISDDGLQHYALQRDVELVVVDGVKGFGNGALLPAGPLRESVSRLNAVDVVISNGASSNLQGYATPVSVQMQLKAATFYNLTHRQSVAVPADFSGKSITAIAGIGNPDRFFNQLSAMGLNFKRKAYNDHYQYCAQDFDELKTDIVIMTEKDAVKCALFAQSNYWVLPVSAEIDAQLMTIILNKLDKLRS
ncbi:tetraacyldisaccharide 4'-kinase [Methylotenera mobilis]|uniref:Tetraacyldisaccharide 4'-kinase n=1 Tax=Methylotenera mobilis (strain JLW8 / ATCC BAA-1282 / DSM 17540) TaxID=583345 RepID=C6WUG0_METML|nr:tetraacyldisaccharide 4'-kinase [Methylotenera mobilis]ACT47559.1 tetraacyldisaccharide 4'-kinase [Methylotenera mobilis JLW8]